MEGDTETVLPEEKTISKETSYGREIVEPLKFGKSLQDHQVQP